MNKRIGSFLMILGLVLLLSAAAITGYNIWDSNRAADAAEDIALQLGTIVAVQRPQTEQTIPEDSTLPQEEIPDYVLAPEMEMPEKLVDGIAYIGILEIPDLELSLPVASNWSDSLLKKTPCRYAGSAYTGDLVIAAHNYERHFGNLGKLFTDSPIFFTDMNGNQFCYKVVEFETLGATAIDEMTSNTGGLTLFTCTVGGQSRLTIRAELIESA